jgi:transcriptional regulator with XRE-family HTH domain
MKKDEVRATLSKNIKLFRNQRGWTQADLAEKAGISVIFLSDIERNNKWPYLDTLVCLAQALEIEVYELLKPEEALPPDTLIIINKYAEEATQMLSQSIEKVVAQSEEAISESVKKAVSHTLERVIVQSLEQAIPQSLENLRKQYINRKTCRRPPR